MILKKLFSFALIAFSSSAFAILSPSRQAFETEKMAHDRHSAQTISNFKTSGSSAWKLSTSLDKLDFTQVADLGSLENLNQVFNYIRDTKFMTGLTDKQLTERRLSWLFPDDGCYIRAELSSYFTEVQKLPEAYKIFGFGELAVETKNHPSGVVRWWYHVVPVYRVGAQAYALDPSIDARAPMTVENWKKAMEGDGPVNKFAVCKPRTLGPEEDCLNPRAQAFEDTLEMQKEFLDREWYRLQQLGRSPEAELGNAPPWM